MYSGQIVILWLLFACILDGVRRTLIKISMNVRPINMHVTKMHAAGTRKARTTALVIAHFGLVTVLIVIITIHVGIIPVRKILFASSRVIHNL